MEQSIKIFLPKKDADEVQRIFDSSDSPCFTILSKFQLSEDAVQLELIAESTFDIWFLAKRVEMIQDHERRMNELINQTKSKQST